MLFINYDIGAMQPRFIPQATHLEVSAIGAADPWQGRQISRVTRNQQKRGPEMGFSNILAEEEDAILTRLAG